VLCRRSRGGILRAGSPPLQAQRSSHRSQRRRRHCRAPRGAQSAGANREGLRIRSQRPARWNAANGPRWRGLAVMAPGRMREALENADSGAHVRRPGWWPGWWDEGRPRTQARARPAPQNGGHCGVRVHRSPSIFGHIYIGQTRSYHESMMDDVYSVMQLPLSLHVILHRTIRRPRPRRYGQCVHGSLRPKRKLSE
jgi:hypothetical protein